MGCYSSTPAMDTLQVPNEHGKKEDSLDQQPRLPGPGHETSCFSCDNSFFQFLRRLWPKSGRVNPIPTILITPPPCN
ncbi:hypothetical protein CAEBREN_18150 [Caenorhabditis brenneri]|uniref:Uncharacterized protein n=1 Tax=Caenorhabditis brenneri TaxID=135651 RepID=G0MH43_CAEBE|nr:hypothetical protein CAEBREN_18150 [Caenorhabditis brenneri]